MKQPKRQTNPYGRKTETKANKIFYLLSFLFFCRKDQFQCRLFCCISKINNADLGLETTDPAFLNGLFQ